MKYRKQKPNSGGPGRPRQTLEVVVEFSRHKSGFLVNPPEPETVIKLCIEGRIYRAVIGPGASLTSAEAAAYLGCNVKRVRELVKEGKLKGKKTRNGRFKISRRELDRHLRAREGTRGRRLNGPTVPRPGVPGKRRKKKKSKKKSLKVPFLNG